ALIANKSTGFTTITTLFNTLRYLSSASVESSFNTPYNSPTMTSPRTDGANVNVPLDSLSVTAPVSESTSLSNPIGSDCAGPRPLTKPYSKPAAKDSINNVTT